MAQKSYLFVTHIAKTGNFCSLNINDRLDRTVVDADDIGDALWRYGLRLRRKYNIELDSASCYYPMLATTLDDNMPEGVVILYGKKTTEDEAGNSCEGNITLAVRIAEAKYLDDKDINVDRCLFDRLDQIVNTRFDEDAYDLLGGPLFAPLNGAKVTGYAQPRDKNIYGSESDTTITDKINDR